MRLFSKLILLRDGEKHVVLYLFVLAALVGFGMSIGQVSSDALFFKLYGIDYLPHMFSLIALVLFFSCIFYAAFVDRLTPHYMLGIMLVGFILMIGLSWFFMLGSHDRTGFALYFIAYGVISEMLLTHFYFYIWSFFDAQQAKRLIPPILAISLLGKSLGGLFVGVVGTYMPIQHVSMVWFFCMGLTFIMLAWWHHGEPKRNVARTGQATTPIKMINEGIAFTKNSRLIRVSAFGMFLLIFLLCVQEYLVGKVFVQHYTDEQSLAKFLGWISAILSLSVLALQFFLSARMLRVFGLKAMNMIYPVSTLLSFGIMAISANFFAAVLGRINTHGVLPGFRNPVAGLFIKALPNFMHGRVGALMTGLILPLGLIAAAIFLILIPKSVELESIAIAGAVISVLLILAKYKKNQAYGESLIDLVGESVFTSDTETVSDLAGIDKSTAFKLAEKIKETDNLSAISNYAELLELLAPEYAGHAMLSVYSSLKPQAQTILLPRIATRAPNEWMEIAWKALHNGDSHLQAITMRFLLEEKFPDAIEKSTEWLETAHPRIQATIAVYSLHAEINTQKARDVLQSLLASDNSSHYLAALGVLSVKPLPEYFSSVQHLLHSKNQQARALSLNIWLQDSQVAMHEAINIINTAMEDESHIVRTSAIQNAARLSLSIPDMPFMYWLTRALRDIDYRVREAGLKSAKNFMPVTTSSWEDELQQQQNNFELQQVMLSELSTSEVEHKDVLLRNSISGHLKRAKNKLMILHEFANHKLEKDSALVLFKLALREDIRRHLTMVLHILGCLDKSKQMSFIRAGLLSDNRQLWAQSMEMAFQIKKESNVFRELSRLYEAEREGVRLKGDVPGGSNSVRAWLNWCRTYGSEWLADCASYCLKHSRLTS